MKLRLALAAILSLLLSACQGVPRPTTPHADVPASPERAYTAAPEPVLVAEHFVTDGFMANALDSLASWLTPGGEIWVLVTARRSHEVQVHAGEDGRLLHRVGGRGESPGRFDGPNGIAVHGDLAFVVERDNHRIQVLRLPSFESLGSFGSEQLRAPYGLWMHERAPGQLEIIVTDSFMEGAPHETSADRESLHLRLHRFGFREHDDEFISEHLGSFGDTTIEGAIGMTGAVWGDPLHERLVVADEHEPDAMRLRVFGLDGEYQGLDLGRGVYQGDPEGIALWACPDGGGYWISVDRREPLSYFLVYDRESLHLLGRFHGTTTAATDGIGLHPPGSASFPDGVLYAVHDGQGIAAFEWTDIASALGLRMRCEY